jgi:hypothetical protein
MPRIAFTIRTVAFVTELGVAVPAQRPYLAVQFLGRQQQRLPYPAFLDTGSAYSVVPYRIANQVPWKDLGGYLILSGQRRAVEWNGIPCRMGELEVVLIDTHAMVRTGPLRVLAKVASQPAPPHLEQAVLLGVSFLTDNRIQQGLDGSGATLSGSLAIP